MVSPGYNESNVPDGVHENRISLLVSSLLHNHSQGRCQKRETTPWWTHDALTSLWCQNDISFLHHKDVIIASCACWEVTGSDCPLVWFTNGTQIQDFHVWMLYLYIYFTWFNMSYCFTNPACIICAPWGLWHGLLKGLSRWWNTGLKTATEVFVQWSNEIVCKICLNFVKP